MQCQVGEYFSDYAGEFESVSAEAAGQGYAIVEGMAVDDEMVVG
jgi:hypothetical protein